MDDFIALIIFAITSTFTPGPNNFMLMNSGMHFGIKRSLPHFFGIAFGFPVMFLVVALGLGEVFTHYTWIKQGLKIVGSLYMLYLAWQILRSHNKNHEGSARKPMSFLQAMMFQWVNPKAWIMGVSAISIFTISDDYIKNALIISLVYLIVCIPFTGVWLLFGKGLQRILLKDSHRLWFNIVMALGLVVSIGMIFID